MTNFRKQFWMSLLLAMVGTTGARAGVVAEKIRGELSREFNGARVELVGEPVVENGTLPGELETQSAKTLITFPSGEARLQVIGANSSAIVRVAFTAWVPAYVVQRRIRPGEAITPDAVTAGEINVASGMAREMRGLLLSPSRGIDGLEARQTILEGGFITTSAVQKAPDLRRGDIVRVDLVRGDLTISTQAVAQEPGFHDQKVRVLTQKNKRELVGVVKGAGLVEVAL